MTGRAVRRVGRLLLGRWRQGPVDGGFSLVEVVILAPLFVAFLLLVVGVGRVQDVGVRITGAARDGARAASLERTAGAAAAAARQAVQDDLAGQDVPCAGRTAVDVDTGGLQPGGVVRVSVRCTADLADVAIPGMPGRATLQKQAVSPIEQYRGTP